MNLDNTSTNSSATSNGLFWVSSSGTATLVTNDFNAAFYGGTNATNMSLLGTFLLSDGTATGDSVGPGFFLDPIGAERIITNASSWCYMQVQAWFGTNTSYAAAVAAGAYAGQSTVFSNGVAGPPGIPPDLTGMPAVVLTAGGGGSSPIFGGDGVSSSGGTSPSGPSGPLALTSTSTTCGLWLSVTTSNSTAIVSLHNTHAGETYLLWSTQLVSAPFTNWDLEASVVGAAGDTTETNISMNGRSDLFFRATEYVTNTVFQGLSHSNTFAVNPDTMGAVGPYFCELVNGAADSTRTAFAVYDKSSGTRLAYTNINGFFAVTDLDGTYYPTGTVTDPRILYDAQSQCFVASAIDIGSMQMLFEALPIRPTKNGGFLTSEI